MGVGGHEFCPGPRPPTYGCILKVAFGGPNRLRRPAIQGRQQWLWRSRQSVPESQSSRGRKFLTSRGTTGEDGGFLTECSRIGESFKCLRYSTNNVTILYSSRLDPGAPSEERRMEADVVVLAAGAWCPYLGELASGVSIPIIPVLGIMWSTSAQERNQECKDLAAAGIFGACNFSGKFIKASM